MIKKLVMVILGIRRYRRPRLYVPRSYVMSSRKFLVNRHAQRPLVLLGMTRVGKTRLAEQLAVQEYDLQKKRLLATLKHYWE